MQYYTIAVGKLNVAKMANFMEIDIFVLVACPENSLVDSQVGQHQLQNQVYVHTILDHEYVHSWRIPATAKDRFPI